MIATPLREQWRQYLLRQQSFLARHRSLNPREVDMAIAALNPEDFPDEEYEAEEHSLNTEYRRRQL